MRGDISMNLTKLFETQRELDAKILLSKGLVGHDLLDKKILALQVELGELANEWQMFKFWKEDREPITEYRLKCPNGCYYGEIRSLKGVSCCDKCGGDGYTTTYPLLEEYVDCLHFILSIGNEFEYSQDNDKVEPISWPVALEVQLSDLISKVHSVSHWCAGVKFDGFYTEEIINPFLGVGTQLGFTWEQIEQAYYSKNKINHER